MRRPALLFLLVMLLISPAPASAQGTNPTPDACGLPKGLSGQRTIHNSVIYTLSADCQQAWRLSCSVSDPGAVARVTITVNGAGHTITAFSNAQGALNVFQLTGNCALVLNNVTIEGGGYQGTGAIQLTNPDTPSSFSNVTFSGTHYNALQIDDQRENSPGIAHTLDNVLIKDTTGSYVAAGHGHPSGIQAIGRVNLNINNLALRNVRGGNAAIGANATYLVGQTRSLGKIALTGCLTVDGVFPRVIYGNFVDNSAGPCSGTVGNNGPAAMQYPQAPVSACGLPLGGFIYGRHVFNLNSDCAMSGTLYIPYESNVVINGGKHTIDSSGIETAIHMAGKTELNSLVVSGAQNSPVVSYLARTMSIANAEFRDNAGPLLIQDSVITLNTVLIENHSVSAATSPSALQVSKSAQVTICDSVFRGNSGGVGALHTGAPFSHVQIGASPATTLAGYVTFENNSPTDIHDPNSLLTDSRSGPCPAGFPGNPHPPESETGPGIAPLPASGCNVEDGALPIGSVACVFRNDSQLAVYYVDEQSRGHFRVAVTQAQVSANGAGMVAASSDGWAAVAVTEDGNVIVSVGPDHEDKVLHVTLDKSVQGKVMGMVTTHDGPPEAGSAAGDATPVPAGAPPNCMVTTRYILNLRETPGGAVMRFIPYDVTLTVTDRAEGWFKVDYHGERGWLSADYVSPNEDCGQS